MVGLGKDGCRLACVWCSLRFDGVLDFVSTSGEFVCLFDLFASVDSPSELAYGEGEVEWWM